MSLPSGAKGWAWLLEGMSHRVTRKAALQTRPLFKHCKLQTGLRLYGVASKLIQILVSKDF